ncbi:MAG: hypothetical protein HPAVJP_2900 [Candidatus Hepatoplasma vulgare]|nr:MAG: hypothetical protein HPAVJP_2900 [Candidatus Hepatoplasma sp.]
MKIVELFSGIGAQAKAFKNIGLKFEVVLCCDWDIYSVISYAFVHENIIIKNERKKIDKILNSASNTEKEILKKEILKKLENYNLSKDGKNKYTNLRSLSIKFLWLLEKSLNITNNIGSIKDLKGENIPKHDLMTYSFPCQDLSLQGLQKGLVYGSSSSLLWEVKRILDELNKLNKLPKFLLMENVKAIFSEKNKKNFKKWELFLEKLGYVNHKFTLNAKYFNIPQNRERAFMFSEFEQNKFIFPKEINLTKLRISNFFDKKDTNNYKKEIKINEKIDENSFKNHFNGIQKIILKNYSNFQSENMVFNASKSISPTITATGALNRIKIFDKKLNVIRILSASELWKIMGFKKQDFDKINNENLISENFLRKQAGNSIVVPVLEEIFRCAFKNKRENKMKKEEYFKIIVNLKSKEKSKYFYSGKGIMIFKKSDHSLVFNTMLLNDEKQIIGSSSNRYGEHFFLKKPKYLKLLKYRNKNFDKTNNKNMKKEEVKFKGNIEELNKNIIDFKLTIKDVDAFITGSHSSGGLSNPNSDPIRLILNSIEIKELQKIYEQDGINNNYEFKFFSLISNSKNKNNNNIFNTNLINDIKEENILCLLKENKMKIKKKYKINKKEEKEWREIKNAFASQNYEIFKNNKFLDLLIVPDKFIFNEKEKIIKKIKTEKEKINKTDLRYIWSKIIENDRKNKKYTKDFVNSFSNFERAHIIENKEFLKILMNTDEKYLDENLNYFFSNNNYLLLDCNVHSLWDKGKIAINENGDIINISLLQEEFDELVKNKKIDLIYDNVLNNERKKFLNFRINNYKLN